MAEAFGLAVNIATIVELSTKIAKVCLQYSKEVNNAREEIARVEKEVLNLKAVAESASELLEGPHGATLKTSKSLLSAAQEAGSRLKALDVELRPSSTRKAMRRFGVRAFKWPFQSKDVEKLVQDIVKYAQMISMGLQIDQTAILLSLDQKFILAKLPTAPDASFDSHAEEHNPTCLPSTRVELLKELDQWIKDPSAEAVFWLSGMAGTGKSTISRTVAQSLAKKDQLGASFFFKRGEGDRGHASKFFTTVASQLVSRLPMLALHVKGAIDADPAIHTKFLREQFKRLIFEPLLKVQGDYSGGSVVIVVDALDECEQDNDIKVIINLFSSGKSLKSPRLKVLLTSRPELPIRLGFSAVRGTYNNLVLHEIPAPIIEHDISAFLEHELARIRDDYNSSVSDERRLSPAWPGKANFQTLVRMAIPLFIFAATTCRFLDQRRRGNPDQQLQRVLNHWERSQESTADLVSKLDLTYRPALDQQLAGLSSLEGNEVLQEFRNIIGTIILLSSPLSAGALAKLLNISQTAVNERLDMLHSVLDVPKEPEFPVRLLHLSFRDFLVDRLYQDSNPFWIDEKEVHRQTATNCLRVMRNHLQEDILDFKVPGTPPSKVNSLDDDRLPPQVKYACLYWTHHAEKAGSGADLLGTVYDFLCRHFLHWLEVLGWLGKAYETLPMLRAIQSAAADSDAGALQEFAGDAVRFVQSNLHIISTAPLQIYSSAHVFTPQRSIVRRTFAETTPSWISLQPEPEQDWDQCLQKFEGHVTGVNSAAFSHDSTLIVSACDQVIQIWRTDTGECIHRFEGYGDGVCSAAFSHDSSYIVSASDDQTVKVWHTDTGECIRILKGHSDSVWSAAFSHDSSYIVSASHDQTVRVWHTDTGECIRILKGHSDSVRSAAFSHDSALIVSSSSDCTIQVWRVGTGECIQKFENHNQEVLSAGFSHDSALIVSASGHEVVRIWNTKAEKHIIEEREHSDAVGRVIISHDSDLIVSSSYDTILVRRTDTCDCIQELKSDGHSKWSMALSHDSALVASAFFGGDELVRVWCVGTGKCVKELRADGHNPVSVVFSHNSTLIASASFGEGPVRIWRVVTGECTQVLEVPGRNAEPLSFSHDSALIAVASEQTVYIWRTGTGKCTQQLEGHDGRVVSVAFSYDSVFVVSASYDKTIRVWNADTGDCIKVVHTYRRDVELLSFQPGIISSEPSCLVTNIGAMAFTSSATETQPCDFVTLGLGLSRDRCWITWNDQNLLWLPAEFRSPQIGVGGTVVRGSTVAIGCTSGRVLVFRFDEAALRMMYDG